MRTISHYVFPQWCKFYREKTYPFPIDNPWHRLPFCPCNQTLVLKRLKMEVQLVHTAVVTLLYGAGLLPWSSTTCLPPTGDDVNGVEDMPDSGVVNSGCSAVDNPQLQLHIGAVLTQTQPQAWLSCCANVCWSASSKLRKADVVPSRLQKVSMQVFQGFGHDWSWFACLLGHQFSIWQWMANSLHVGRHFCLKLPFFSGILLLNLPCWFSLLFLPTVIHILKPFSVRCCTGCWTLWLRSTYCIQTVSRSAYAVMPRHASSAVLEDASAPFPQFCVVGSSFFL